MNSKEKQASDVQVAKNKEQEKLQLFFGCLKERRVELMKRKADLQSKGEWPGIYKQAEETMPYQPISWRVAPFMAFLSVYSVANRWRMRPFTKVLTSTLAYMGISGSLETIWSTRRTMARLECPKSLERDQFCYCLDKYSPNVENNPLLGNFWATAMQKCKRNGDCNQSLSTGYKSVETGQENKFTENEEENDPWSTTDDNYRNNLNRSSDKLNEKNHWEDDDDDGDDVEIKRSIAEERLAQKRSMIRERYKGGGDKWQTLRQSNDSGWNENDDEWGDNLWNDGDEWGDGDVWEKEK